MFENSVVWKKPQQNKTPKTTRTFLQPLSYENNVLMKCFSSWLNLLQTLWLLHNSDRNMSQAVFINSLLYTFDDDDDDDFDSQSSRSS